MIIVNCFSSLKLNIGLGPPVSFSFRTRTKLSLLLLSCSKLNFPSFSSALTTTTPSSNVNLSSREQTLMSLSKKCSTTIQIRQIHAHTIKSGFHQSLFVMGKVIAFSAVSELGDMNYAVSVFENIENPDGFLWNTMIRGFVKSNQSLKAFEYYKTMQDNGYCSDNFTFSFLLKASGQLGSFLLGQQMHCSSIKHGLESHVFVRNTLIHMYGMVKDIETANQMFDEIPKPDLVAWNTIIDCHVNCGRHKEAIGLFSRMLRNGVQPDEATLVVTLSACSESGALDFGRWLGSCIFNTTLGDITSVSNSLIDMFAKCGALEEAYNIFDKMTRKNIISWNTMILGLATHGYAEKAMSLFTKMLKENREKPDNVTFLGVLCACSHGGMVDEGRRYFNMMCEEYKIKPTIKHYGSMVDILARAGFVEEAYGLIRRMPMECNAVVWRTLLGACMVHGNVEIGERVRMQLLELEPDHSSDYVLLANMYASVGQWIEVMKVRDDMKHRGVNKPEPGNSYFSVGLLTTDFLRTSNSVYC